MSLIQQLFEYLYHNVYLFYQYGRTIYNIFSYGIIFLIRYICYKYIYRYHDDIISANLGKYTYCKLNELGPVFIKIGQIISLHDFWFPKLFIDEIKKLLDNTTKMNEKQLQYMLADHDLSIYESFDMVPFASGSIAQIHKGVLKNGKDVAIKILKYDIDTNIKINLHIFSIIIDLIEYICGYRLRAKYNKLSHTLLQQIDFITEMNNQKICHNIFRKSKYLYAPEVYEMYCSKSIIVMEYINGYSINRLSNINNDEFKKEIVKRLLGMNISLSYNGISHCDLHTSNILYRESDDKICLIDFGIVSKPSISTVKSWLYFLKLFSEDKYEEAIIPFVKFVIDKNDLKKFETILFDPIEGIIVKKKFSILFEKYLKCDINALYYFIKDTEIITSEYNVNMDNDSIYILISLLSVVGTLNNIYGPASIDLIKEIGSYYQSN